MVNALIFRAIERNTGGVGVKSALCTQTPVNPEVAAITQHQDPASDGAAATNKAIVLALAKEKNLFFMEALWTRFHPLTLELKKIAEEGTLGDPVVLHADLSADFHIEGKPCISIA